MSGLDRVVLVGAGGHASDVLALLEQLTSASGSAPRVVGLLDDRPDPDVGRFSSRGVGLLGGMEQIGRVDATHLLLAVGWPQTRSLLADRLAPWSVPALPGQADPRAMLHDSVDLGAGALVFAGASVSPLVTIGEHALVSYNAIVGHDTQIGAFCSVMPGAVLSGECVVGARALVGTNATVLEGRTIGDDARVGAGAVVVDDVPAGATVVGVPARSPD